MKIPIRIITIKGHGYGTYQLQEWRPFLFFFKKWKSTHLFKTLPEAIRIAEWLRSDEYTEIGKVVKTFD